MDARLVKLSLACCAVGMARPAVGQGIPTWNLYGWSRAKAEVHDSWGTLFFVRDSYYQDIPPGETTVVIDGYSCAGWQGCKGGPCSPPVDGSIEFAIASQSILVTLEGGLTTWPAGVVEFEVEIAQPTTVTWPGGSVTLFPGNPDDRWLYVPVTASPAGFPIVFSAPFALQSIHTSMYVDVPPSYHRYCNESMSLGCPATMTLEECRYWYGTSWLTSGDFIRKCEFVGDEGFHCWCVDKYTDVSAEVLSKVTVSLDDGRFDLDLSVEWGCPNFFSYVNSRAEWVLELDRPTRLVWDYASCGGSQGIFNGQCDGPGSFEVNFPPLPPPNAYGYGGSYTYSLALIWVFLGMPESGGEGETGSETFRIENLRFERIYPADVVADGVVNGQDISAILSKWGGPYDPQRTAADVNLDGRVGAEDLALVLFAWDTPG